MSKRHVGRAAGTLAVMFLAWIVSGGSVPTAAEDGWTDTAEFSFVQTSGNSESSTFGFKNVLAREWDRAGLVFRAGGVKIESTRTDRFAVGTPSAFAVTTIESKDTTAENYFFNGRYDHKISESFFWYAGAGWDRNEFAGIRDRYVAEGGVGNVWYDTDDIKFSTGYGLTYTQQDDVNPIPGADDSFAGARFSWDYRNKFGGASTYTNTLVVDSNLEETSDYRADMLNALSVAMNDRLALKIGLQFLFDNEPAFASIRLLDAPGGTQIGNVPFELDDLDTIFTASLVVNFP